MNGGIRVTFQANHIFSAVSNLADKHRLSLTSVGTVVRLKICSQGSGLCTFGYHLVLKKILATKKTRVGVFLLGTGNSQGLVSPKTTKEV